MAGSGSPRVEYDMVARGYTVTLWRSVCCSALLFGFLKLHHGPALADQRSSLKTRAPRANKS